MHVQQLRWIVYRSHIKLPSQVACPHIVCELIAWVTIKSLMSLICAKQNYHSWDFTRSMIPHITSHKGAIRGKMTLLLQMKPFDSLVLHCGLKRFVNVGYHGVGDNCWVLLYVLKNDSRFSKFSKSIFAKFRPLCHKDRSFSVKKGSEREAAILPRLPYRLNFFLPVQRQFPSTTLF